MGITLRDIGIPPRPSILNDIDREMANARTGLHASGGILGSDVALGAALLKSVNSPFFGFDKRFAQHSGGPARARPEARHQHHRRHVLAPGVPPCSRHGALLDASASTARVSGWLARRLHRCCWVRPEDAYTFGLFRDCGIPPILMGPFPDYRALLGVAGSERVRRFTDIENDRLSVNHADVGAMLAGPATAGRHHTNHPLPP